MVSDDIKDGGYQANTGTTLPSGINASYNAGATPLFLTRGGRVSTNDILSPTGESGTFLSSNADGKTWVYWLSLDNAYIYPSQRNVRTNGRSLRCLVSTNNG